MNALTLYRFAHWLYLRRVPVFPKFLQICIFLLFNSYIPYQVIIGKGTRIGHRGIAVVINKEAIIGENVLIRAHVTIGKKSQEGKAPVIGNHVSIGDGAKILGDVKIGDYAQIGANAVVLKNLPAHSIAVGVPARIINEVDND